MKTKLYSSLKPVVIVMTKYFAIHIVDVIGVQKQNN